MYTLKKKKIPLHSGSHGSWSVSAARLIGVVKGEKLCIFKNKNKQIKIPLHSGSHVSWSVSAVRLIGVVKGEKLCIFKNKNK